MKELQKFGVEFLGTLFFIASILYTGNAYIIGIVLIIVILIGGSISGGHLNPMVSLAKYLQMEINVTQLLFYIVAQCLGGFVALMSLSI